MIIYNMSVLMGENNSGSSPKIKCNDTGVCLRIFPVIRTPLSKYRDKLEEYRIPSHCTAVLKVAKTDKTYALTDGQIEGNSMLFKLPAQACTKLGKALAEVNIFGEDGRRVTTGTFVLEVVDEAVSDHSPDSQVYVDILAEYIKGVTEAKNAAEAAAERAEKAAEAAEGSGGTGGGQVHGPIIGEDGSWWLWDSDLDQYVNSGVNAYGEDGHTPQKGVDYFTPEDIEDLNIPVVDDFFSETSENAIQNKVVTGRLKILSEDLQSNAERAGALGVEVAGIQQQINQHAHFKGYFPTNAKIKATEATPNDFAYSAESGTKWVYDEAEGWQDTGTPVPDQLTPASDKIPLMNGEAAVGEEQAYARGDHRHPVDTSRASAAELNALKSEISSALAEIISLQNSLIGGGAE